MLPPRSGPLPILFGLACAMATLPLGGSARAATLCVSPGGVGGCFAAVQAAVDAASRGDLIEIAPGTYLEAVVVPERARLTLQGADVSTTVLSPPAGSALTLGQGNALTIRDLTIQGGSPYGILNVHEGVRLELERSAVRDCADTGVHHWGRKLTISDSTIAGNGGTGVYVRFGRAAVRRSTIDGNGGSGIDIERAGLIVSDTTISNNVDISTGGGIYIGRGGVLTLINSTLSGNSAEYGGGIYTAGPRFFRNPAGQARIRSSTIAGNQATYGGGIAAASDARMRLANTLIADNLAPQGADCFLDDTGLILSRGYNLLEDFGLCDASLRASDISGADPMLGALAANGGTTETHALLPGSPAIDAGDPSPATGRGSRCPPADQRGVARTNRCDIGAYES